MTAILGAYNFSHTGEAIALTEAMLRDNYLNGLVEKRGGGENISFGSIDGNGRAFVLESNGSVLALFGTLFLPSGTRLTTEAQFESEFIPKFRKDWGTFLAGCDGAFCFAFYDEATRSLYLGTDPFGNLPFYYAKTDHSVLFCTRQRPIALAINAPIDQLSLGQYIRSGTIIGPQAYYEDVTRPEPATICRITNQGVVTKVKYFSPSYAYKKYSEIPDVIDQIGNGLTATIRREIDQTTNSGVALTGGFDSRTTLSILIASQQTKDVSFFTHGTLASYDMEIAAQLSAAFGLRHETLVFDDAFFRNAIGNFDSIVALSEGGLGLEASLSIGAMQWQGSKFNSVFDSHGGQIYRRTIFKARSKMLNNDLVSGLNKLLVSTLAKSPFLLPETTTYSTESVKKELTDYFSILPHHLVSGDKIDRFFIDRLCNNKYSNVGNIEMNYARLVHPLLDRESAELLSQIPEDFRRKNLVYENLFQLLVPTLM